MMICDVKLYCPNGFVLPKWFCYLLPEITPLMTDLLLRHFIFAYDIIEEDLSDGDHLTQPILEQATALSHVQRSSIAKEVHLLVRNGLMHSDSEAGH